MSAHCSPWAPGGVSQRTCQSLWTDLTAPCAAARSVVAATVAPAIAVTASSAFIAWKSIRGLNEAIVSRASNPGGRPAPCGGCCSGRRSTVRTLRASFEGAKATMLMRKPLTVVALTVLAVLASAGAALADFGQPAPWQFGFQEAATPVMDRITWF